MPSSFLGSSVEKTLWETCFVTDYARPSRLQDALAIAAKGAVTIAAGCTDLFPATQAQQMPGAVLDITNIEGMRGVTAVGDGWRIGGATTWTDILQADLPPAFNALKQAAAEVGSVQIQNAGTIAGNLCNASPAADGVPPLLVLDAQVELVSVDGQRMLPLGQFLRGPRQTDLRSGELLSAILIPTVSGLSAFQKLGARKYLVISIAMVAARVTIVDGRMSEAAISVGACSATATRLPKLEAALIGAEAWEARARITPSLITSELAPIDDMRADASYRESAAAELVLRVLDRVIQEAHQ